MGLTSSSAAITQDLLPYLHSGVITYSPWTALQSDTAGFESGPATAGRMGVGRLFEP